MSDKPKVTKKFSGGTKKAKKKAQKRAAPKIKVTKGERSTKPMVSQAEIDAGFPAKGKTVAIRWFTMAEKREYDNAKEAIAADLRASGEKPTVRNVILTAMREWKKAA